MELNKLIYSIKNAGKIERFDIYIDILKKLALKIDKRMYKVFDQFILHLQDYLIYDPKPVSDIKKNITTAFLCLFIYIRDEKDKDGFQKYLPIFKKYYHFFEDNIEKAKLLKGIGYLNWMMNDLDASISAFEESLQLANLLNDQTMLSRYTNLGYIYECKGDFQTAEDYYLQGLKFARDTHCQQAMFMAYNAMGRLNFNLEYFKKAQRYFQAAMDLRDNEDIDQTHLPTIMNLASTYVFLNDYPKAIESLKILQQDWVKDQNPELYYTSFTNMAVYYIKMGKIQLAIDSNNKALTYGKEHHDLEILFSYYYNLINIRNMQNNYHLAIEAAKKALDFAIQADDKRKQALANNALADIFMKTRCYKEAEECYSKADAFYRKNKDKVALMEIIHSKALCFSAVKNYKNAYLALTEYLNLKQKIQKDKNKKEEFLDEQNIIKASKTGHVFFNTGYTIIAKELAENIGIPIVGQSPQMKEVLQQAILIAGNDNASVLLRGESGTGKELIARLIHFASDRKKAPFVPINSSTLTSGLAQSTLFGHEKGAFTGAVSEHKGLFEQADKGTVFLDEIADMPRDIQAYLLRIIEDKKIRRLGGCAPLDADFRLIAATNANLNELVKSKTFRHDLLNRINTFEIIIPPLRERLDDIPLLIDFYLKDISNRLNRTTPKIEAAVIDVLLSYDYPGNVREFVNIMEKLIIFCKKDFISVDDVCFLKINNKYSNVQNKIQNLNLQENEVNLINLAMKKANNIQKEAAKLLGIPDYTLSRKLKKMHSNH